jgi:hypothetical protein
MEESCPISIGGAVEGLLEASTMRLETPSAHPPPSPVPQKRHLRPSSKVDAVCGLIAEETGKVRREASMGPPIASVVGERVKLLIFNIHGTLLDCSLFIRRKTGINDYATTTKIVHND